jgi:hypothetical protein
MASAKVYVVYDGDSVLFEVSASSAAGAVRAASMFFGIPRKRLVAVRKA